MNATFYEFPRLPAVALMVAGLAACGRETPAPAPSALVASVFTPAVPGLPLRWEPPDDGDWTPRWIHHLQSGSREGQRFALDQLRRAGPASGPALGAAVRAASLDPSAFGVLVNLLAALGASGARAEWPVLAEIIRTHPTPVVRTAAGEAAAALREPALLPTLREALERETEVGPRRSFLNAIARIGGAEAVAELEARVNAWLFSAGRGGAGAETAEVWNSLMLVEGPELLPALERLDAHLPPPLRVQALTARLELGDRSVGPALATYLDAAVYPAPKTRMLALTALADLGEWGTIVAAAADPTLEVRRAVARLLGKPEAGAAGADLLDGWLGDDDQELREAALAALVARGQRHRLDPWLQQVRGFPLRPGSTDALFLLTRDPFLDPRLAGVLLQCWEDAHGEQRLDLMRAMTKTGAPAAAERIAAAMLDSREDAEVRRVAATLIANFPDCREPLLRWYQEEPTAERAADLVAGLGRHPEDPESRAALLRIAADDAAPDPARKVVLDVLPKIYGLEACAMLQDLRSRTQRPEVYSYLSQLLVSWY